MDRLPNRLLCALLCVVLLLGAPLAALATDASSLDSMSQDDNEESIEESIAENPDLTEEEKQQWMEWASEETDDDTATADDEEAAALLEALEDAIVDTDQTSDLDPEDLEINEALPDNVTNILLLGVDNRSVALQSGLSDAVIICSINTGDGSVKLTSITRDTEVEIPGYKNTKRINCAFKFGSKDGDLDAGGKLAMKTVNRNFQMNIQRYVVVTSTGWPAS